KYDVDTGLIQKDNGKTPDISTLLTFTFPPESEKRQCQFIFSLDSASELSGSEQFDLFTSLAPAAGPTTTWPPGNLRDQYVGRFKAQIGGDATPIDHSYVFPCPAGKTLGYELVGVYDVDHIKWKAGATGPKIVIIDGS